MAAPDVRVDDDGIHVADGYHGSPDVLFDGHRVWSFSMERDPGAGPTVIAWPRSLQRRLVGRGEVRIEDDDTVLYAGSVAFGGSEEPLDLRDKTGTRIMIDKWGLIQRPFEIRRESGVVEVMVDKTEEILRVMREECGIEGWLSFGTLLGAARSGAVIGHDSDIDLCYLSEQATPSLMAVELWRIGRALRAAGMELQHKSASFLTVKFTAPDGGVASIDVYTTFFLDGVLHETATVRTPMPRSAVLPLGTIEFEGRMLPAPADVAALLAASYGPRWETPDPSFKHRPGPEIVRRFDGWFGALMRGRRDWNRIAGAQARDESAESGFAHFVGSRLEPATRVVDLGSGSGADVAYYASLGHGAVGLDYVMPTPVRRRLRGTPARPGDLNLYDLRDVLTRGALLARGEATGAVCARDLFETLDADGVTQVWRLVDMCLRRGGHLYLEGRSLSRDDASTWAEQDSGPLRSFDPQQVLDEVRRRGARVVHREGLAEAGRAVRGGPPARWRLVVAYPDRAAEARSTRSTTASTTNQSEAIAG